MTQFETWMVTAIQDLAGEVGTNNTMYARLDERLKALEKRFDESPPTSTPAPAPRHRKKISAREATFGGTAIVSAALAILQAIIPPHVPPPPPPRPPTPIEAQK